MPLFDADNQRLVAGLMSGTSLDGVDVAIARLAGSGPQMTTKMRVFVEHSYPDALRDLLLANSRPDTSSVYDLSQLNVRLAHVYTEAVRRAVDEAGFSAEDLDLVGSHGQTVHHVPDADDCAGAPTRSTLQIGDPSTLANRLGVPAVGDFRLADMALGGQGAPLVPYFDFVQFAHAQETRGLLNLGGIANLTVLPAGAGPEAMTAFDTGPANMVIDALAERYFDAPYDAGGEHAASGTVQNHLLADLLDQDEFFSEEPPKSTGRERYGSAYVDRLVSDARSHGVDEPEDVLATATALTAASVYQAYARFVRSDHEIDRLIVAGGGLHNDFLMQRLSGAFAPIEVEPADAHDVDPDAKEALCFAVLAHETMNRVPTGLPSVTGAEKPALLGKICLPS
ncbi:MAG: anhydro-N-acetylmuramic acid kinase [Bacteroidetes bacterium QS_8_64_10]|jgi:anhydro-N-acetylmuramic acid kinase|nr:MAG: anhydro-N-acetylmuramic acid kinase [Bacteroidetes bacterium QS_8_64_10]